LVLAVVGCAAAEDTSRAPSPQDAAAPVSAGQSSAAAGQARDGVGGPRRGRAAFRELFAQPEVSLDVQNASPAEAVATISGCPKSSRGRCLFGVVVTGDGWRTERGVVLADKLNPFEVWVGALPDGSAAVVANRPGQRRHIAFVLRPGGGLGRLRLTRTPAAPGPGAVLAPRPAGISAQHGEVWVVDPARARLHPARRQPCDCRRNGFLSELVTGPDGTVYALISYTQPESVADWHRLVRSRDGGRSWDAPAALPEGYAPYWGGLTEVRAGPGTRLAIAWTSDPGTDPGRKRVLVTDDGTSWRRIDTAGARRFYAGMAFAPDGTLIVATSFGGDSRLWRVPPGATAIQSAGRGPGGYYWLRQPGPLLLAADLFDAPGVAISRDGRRWRTVTPGSTLR
jgi:hypothetical protein